MVTVSNRRNWNTEKTSREKKKKTSEAQEPKKKKNRIKFIDDKLKFCLEQKTTSSRRSYSY